MKYALRLMHRFYLPPDLCQGPVLTLRDREAHHGVRVLRLQRGEQVLVLDGAGREFQTEVRSLDRNGIELSVLGTKSFPPWSCQTTLLQAIPKGHLFEDIIRKATELGVGRIVPLLTERVATRLNAEQTKTKREHWREIAIEAIKQCGSVWLPQIESPIQPQQFLARAEKLELALIGSLQGDRQHPREGFNAFFTTHQRAPRSVSVWVGPEGDFTPAEHHAIQAGGALPISLGPLVLRTETAALCCLSIVNHEARWLRAQSREAEGGV
jgi:16S rRNA (uracil1498-N3)-methyltransferase